MSNGKGDKPRPISVDSKTYENNWERTFGSSTKSIDKRLEELQHDINVIREKLDNCEYSGLPTPESYDK